MTGGSPWTLTGYWLMSGFFALWVWMSVKTIVSDSKDGRIKRERTETRGQRAGREGPQPSTGTKYQPSVGQQASGQRGRGSSGLPSRVRNIFNRLGHFTPAIFNQLNSCFWIQPREDSLRPLLDWCDCRRGSLAGKASNDAGKREQSCHQESWQVTGTKAKAWRRLDQAMVSALTERLSNSGHISTAYSLPTDSGPRFPARTFCTTECPEANLH